MSGSRMIFAGLITVALIAGASTASANAAHLNATGPWTASAATTQFRVGSSALSCTTSDASGDISSAGPAGSSTAVNVHFSGCTWHGFVTVPVGCSGNNRLLVDAIPSGTTVRGRLSLVAGACTLTWPGCTMTLPSGGYTSPAASATLDTTAQTVTLDAPLNVPYLASGFGCALSGLPSSGTLQWSGAGGVDLVYGRTNGNPWSVTYP